MAERRMFAKSIVLSGRFMKLPPVAQILYYRLCMQADDDGFHDSPEFTMQGCGATRQHLHDLEEQGFVHCFESGILVILHWRVHNQIRKDRHRQTIYIGELSQLTIGKTGEYILVDMVANLATQDRIGKDRIGKDSLGQDITPVTKPGDRSVEEDPPRLSDILCYALDHGIHTDYAAFYNHYSDLQWPDRTRYTWKRLLKQWEEEYAGTS